jgi:uncharacterized protein
MKQHDAPKRLDVKATALAAQHFSGDEVLSNYERLMPDLEAGSGDAKLAWSANFETRSGATGSNEPWLHITLATRFALVCQRCLGALDWPVSVQRSFRFVASDAVAEKEDDDCEEDLLVSSREFDLSELIEDELVLALPLIPLHEVCPDVVKMTAVDADFDAAQVKPHPFAGLAGLKKQDGRS